MNDSWLLPPACCTVCRSSGTGKGCLAEGKFLMPPPQLVLYSPAPPRCTCRFRVFAAAFECHIALSAASFHKKIHAVGADAAVVCFCSARAEQAPELLTLGRLDSLVPVISCSESLDPDFIQQAAQHGIDRFVLCDMAPEKIRDIIYEAIRHGGLKAFLEARHPGSLSSSPHTHKMIDEIVHSFPHRLSEYDIARRLGISRSWLQKLCRRFFDLSFKQLLRRIWVYHALRLMQHTNLDNGEIALQLNYSEASNLARDFRKELGCSPTAARLRLATQRPEKLFRDKK